jgi:hypothetical protein
LLGHKSKCGSPELNITVTAFTFLRKAFGKIGESIAEKVLKKVREK